MDIFVALIEKVGLPLALLAMVVWHHVRTIAQKDQEIARVNEARLKEANDSAQRMLEVATEFTELTGETNQTLALLAERLPKSSRR